LTPDARAAKFGWLIAAAEQLAVGKCRIRGVWALRYMCVRMCVGWKAWEMAANEWQSLAIFSVTFISHPPGLAGI